MNFTSDWFSRNIPVWQKIVIPLLGKDISWLEIGTYEGRSAIWTIENVLLKNQGHITCVDSWTDVNIENRFDTNIREYASQVTKIKQVSSKYLSLAFLNNKVFDVIYIDASHNAESLILDSALSWNILKNNGILIFDDYEWKLPKDKELILEQPKIGIDSFLRCYHKHIKILHTEYQVIIQKRV